MVDEELDALAYVRFEAGDPETLVRVRGEDFGKLLNDARRGFSSPS
jgi:prolyl-tRNA editing enzyme YbaK/EbsC (Cys-tRNA(Pro) deacylase)